MDMTRKLWVVVTSFVTVFVVCVGYAYVDGYALRDAFDSAVFVMMFYGPIHLLICGLMLFVFEWSYATQGGRAVSWSIAMVIVMSGVVALTLFVMDGLDELRLVPTVGLVVVCNAMTYVSYVVLRKAKRKASKSVPKG